MNKKIYIAPVTETMVMESEEMIAATTLDATSDTQSIAPTAEEYAGEFAARIMMIGE